MRYPHLEPIRSIMETPILDRRKWDKVPTLPSDAVLVDMEDTVAQARKLEGREAVVDALGQIEHFGDRSVLCRPNGLETPWWHEDVAALARAGAQNILLPKITRAGDVLAFQRTFRQYDADPYLLPCIETPGGVANVEEIAELDRVAGLVFGAGDLTAMTGLPICAADGSTNPMVMYSRSRVYLAAAASNLAMIDMPFVGDIQDADAFERGAEALRIMGATALFAMYPPHIGIINDVFTPNEGVIADAELVIRSFERAAAEGQPAIQIDGGRTLLIHDYNKALGVLSRAGRV